MFKIARVISGRVKKFQISRVACGRARKCFNLTGRVGSGGLQSLAGQEVSNLSRVGSGQVKTSKTFRGSGHLLTRPDPTR